MVPNIARRHQNGPHLLLSILNFLSSLKDTSSIKKDSTKYFHNDDAEECIKGLMVLKVVIIFAP